MIRMTPDLTIFIAFFGFVLFCGVQIGRALSAKQVERLQKKNELLRLLRPDKETPSFRESVGEPVRAAFLRGRL